MDNTLELTNFSDIVSISAPGHYEINHTAMLQNYVTEFDSSIGIMLFFIVFSFFYGSSIHPFIKEHFGARRGVSFVSDRIMGVSQMLAQGASVFLLWVVYKQGLFSPRLAAISVVLLGLSIMIFLGSLVRWVHEKTSVMPE